MVNAARAVIEEVPSAASTSISALAQCHEQNAERDVHLLSEKFRLVALEDSHGARPFGR